MEDLEEKIVSWRTLAPYDLETHLPLGVQFHSSPPQKKMASPPEGVIVGS